MAAPFCPPDIPNTWRVMQQCRPCSGPDQNAYLVKKFLIIKGKLFLENYNVPGHIRGPSPKPRKAQPKRCFSLESRKRSGLNSSGFSYISGSL